MWHRIRRLCTIRGLFSYPQFDLEFLSYRAQYHSYAIMNHWIVSPSSWWLFNVIEGGNFVPNHSCWRVYGVGNRHPQGPKLPIKFTFRQVWPHFVANEHFRVIQTSLLLLPSLNCMFQSIIRQDWLDMNRASPPPPDDRPTLPHRPTPRSRPYATCWLLNFTPLLSMSVSSILSSFHAAGGGGSRLPVDYWMVLPTTDSRIPHNRLAVNVIQTGTSCK